MTTAEIKVLGLSSLVNNRRHIKSGTPQREDHGSSRNGFLPSGTILYSSNRVVGEGVSGWEDNRLVGMDAATGQPAQISSARHL